MSINTQVMIELDEWIEREFRGHGRALRERNDPPLPGEPYMSMLDAKSLTRRAVLEFLERSKTEWWNKT